MVISILIDVRKKWKEGNRMGYIVALDIGVASVGWAVIEKGSETVIESGSNIFPEASAANNQMRREMRQARRIKRREKTRLNDFMKLWQKYDFSIPQFHDTNVLELKVKALHEEISLDELYYILYHYLKHRGISYLEDAIDDSMKATSEYEKGLQLNEVELRTKFPCEIQKERLESIGRYRGETQITTPDGEILDLSNVFTTGAYNKEIQKIFEIQREYHNNLCEEFQEEYFVLFNRKRKYYEGPGNEKSRTDYGKYTTQLDENGKYITEENIFKKLIGKCSVYKEELRAAAASYTAQEFNVLNDLNNLTINERKLTENEKREIVEKIKTSKTVNMKKIIAEVMNEKIVEFKGARIDKNEKEIFHKFETYNKMRKELSLIDVDITDFSRGELDEIGYILTINTDKDAMEEAFCSSTLDLKEEVVECLIKIRKSNGSLFDKWHSFSLKIMNELIPVMYEQPKEQMTLLSEMGLGKQRIKEFSNVTYIPLDAASEDIFNPVVRRSVRISFKILNALLKKYKVLDEVVIEMPRDRNLDEQKKRIKDIQKSNEKEMKYIEEKLISNYDLKITSANYSSQKQLNLKLKLWNEQDGKCLYSGKVIDPKDILDFPDRFEIDHIIPRSISFDDSRNNKVLVYRTENQKKGNQTPYYYLNHVNKEWSFEQYKETVLCLSRKKEYGLSRKKVQNLLFSEDITKIDVMRGFINRNLNDTRYASRVVLNIVQSFFEAKEMETKVKTIKGSYTHQMRVNMKLDKDRDLNYAHHAVDAMLIAFSQLGYESYKKLQGGFIDFETGEILDQKVWDEKMSDDVYANYLYGMRWTNIRDQITKAEKEVKYWHLVDHKSNRGLCNQTIRGTREYDVKTYKINKLDIRTDKGASDFKKFALSDKESDKEKLLVYRNDRKTFDELVKIVNDYSEAKNPFVQYEKETGDYVRKYAKKHNGPKIDKLKYTDGEIGSCIDISHKYGYEKDSRKVVLESLVPYRMDVYYKEEEKSYYFVGLKQSDIKMEANHNIIDEDAYTKILLKEKMIQPGQSRKDLEDLGFTFKLSFYRNDIIEYEKGGVVYRERFLSRTMPQQRNYIETKPLNCEKFSKRNLVGLGKTKRVVKYTTDILGNYFLCENEKFSRYC